jgi:hypothetical protein
VLTQRSFQQVTDAIRRAPAPTQAMKDLMADRPVEGEPGE